MAEFNGDFFGGLNDAIKKSNELQNRLAMTNKEIKDISGQYIDMFETQGQIREKILKTDTKWYQLLSKSAKTMGNIVNAVKDHHKIRKDLLKSEKLTAKLEDKLKKGEFDSNEQLKKSAKEKIAAMIIQNQMTKDQNSLLWDSIPIINLFGESITKALGPIGIIYDILKGIFSVLGGIVGFALKQFSKLLSSVFKKALEVERVSGNISANIGLSEANSQKLLMNMSQLAISAIRYGGELSDVTDIFETFADQTGRIRMFTPEDVGVMVELGRGTGLAADGVSDMAASFDLIGISLDRTIEFGRDSVDMAAKLSINVTKLLKNSTTLLEEFKGFNFKGGLSDITQMAAKAQSLRFDLGNMRSLADNLFDLENAVEASARLRVLGGNFAAMADPITMMFNAMNDPQQLFNDTLDSLKGLVEKNEDGFFYIPPQQRGILRDVADALGQDVGQLTTAAIKQAEIADKIRAAGAGFFTEEDRLALANMITVGKGGGYEIEGKSLQALKGNASALRELVANQKANEEASQERLDFIERLKRLGDIFVQGLTPVITNLSKILTSSGLIDKLTSAVSTASTKISQIINNLLDTDNPFIKIANQAAEWIKGMADEFENFFKDVNSKNFSAKMKELFLIGIKVMVDTAGPYMRNAFAKMWNETVGEMLLVPKMRTTAELESLQKEQDTFRRSFLGLPAKSMDDFIYSQNNGVMEFNKDDLIIGGTGLINSASNNEVSSNRTINVNVSGTLKIENDGRMVTLSPDDMKKAGIMALARAVSGELHKMDRGTYKEDSSTVFKSL